MTNHLRYETGELKACIDLRKVIEHFWGPGKPEGRAVRYAAHWRDDGRRDSFYVYDDGYKDFASGEAGDLLDWLQKEGIAPDFPSAAQWAINYLGGQVAPVDHPIIRSNRTSLQSTTPDWQQAALKALEESQRYLWSERREPKSILAYLQQERGLTEATIHQRSLGYNPSWHKTDYRNPDTGKLAKLPPGIVIPIWENGQLVALRVRCRVGTLAVWLDIDPDQFGSGRHEGEELPKYLNLAGSRLSGVLFNGDAVVSGQPVLLVEGEFDAMLADQILNANRDDPIA
ncbi:MAG: hypothetical protein K8J31_01070, partial [Anaerolineae bacterium]|nr:hypothetical protein [Anaerolineae bacterium]